MKTLFYFSISLTILSNVFYHVFQKLTPRQINPFVALSATYGVAMVICLAFGFLSADESFLESIHRLNWTNFALGFAIVGLEVGFLLAYRAGWNISLGALVSNVATALILIPVGLLFFREKLLPTNLIGIVVCIVGLVMFNQK